MRAELKELHSPDVHDLATFVPDDPARFGVLIQLIAGPEGEPGEESFDVVVCTPAWLSDQVRAHGPLSGRHHLVVETFDWPVLREYFANLVRGCEGRDWREVATKLSRHGAWEFEDHRP
jgi:hypothetical protein